MMIHVFTVAHPFSRPALENRFGSTETDARYRVALATLTREVVERYTGESLYINTPEAHGPAWSSAPPISLMITLTVEWSEQLHDLFDLIQRQIVAEIRSWDPSLADAKVVLNVFGGWDPTKPRKNVLAMPIWDIFEVAHQYRLGQGDMTTALRLTNAGIKTVGQLIRYSPDEIRQQTEVRWKGLRNLIWSLEQFDLTLRANDIVGPRTRQLVKVPPDPTY